ncbi:MAG: cation transporter [Marinobacter sp.]|jgi:cobalt-zinc-cadmium efflux system protein|uniref:cation diffusion facilitator family transporter n=1 Tax=Marinobacter sp. SS8-8 TaxID=3050452 RepID=UPI000C5BF9AE|nr:cation diffusion facilitator family transporter [Marinobacter sp. SS8-8]MAZ06182.1 cation transporter [Halomonas sp.]MBI47984.1 cation transporter [Marinobacter sp.]|tara:strand:+ start:47066 stop:47974 length:909 start_codon:yes stop_codon:yes gene_type:complete
MSHEHVHLDPESKDKRVAIAIWANGILTLAQIGGGIFAGSLALIADALHNFSDMVSLVIAFAARKIARRPADSQMTFGYGRVEIVAALINYTSLIIIGLYLVYEGGMRIIDPPEIKGWWVVWLGGIALVVDTLTALLTYSMQKGSVNIRALFLHNLSDALASVAVVIGGTLILLYDMRWVDPAITIGIAGYILYLGLTEIGGTIRTLMLASPEDIDTEAVIQALSDIDGVIGLHHVHFWQMGEHEASLEAHVVIEENAWGQLENTKYRIKQALEQNFNIQHSTLEFEHPDYLHRNARTFGHE